jgi:hypothetical protein
LALTGWANAGFRGRIPRAPDGETRRLYEGDAQRLRRRET